MPFVVIGLLVVAGAGAAAYFLRSGESAAGEPTGATLRAPDPVSAPTTAAQTTSAVESPSDVTVEASSAELPDRFASSSAATTTPIGRNTVEDPFLDMAAIPGNDVSRGYAVDDLSPVNTGTPFVDDVELPADVAFAPASYSGGLRDELLK